MLSPSARQDILDITDFIADASVDAALRFRDRLFGAFDVLGRNPGLGHVRDDLATRHMGVRFWTVGRYLIVYRAAGETVQIVRVLSGYRDLAVILGQRSE